MVKNLVRTHGANEDIRTALYENGVKQWQVADKLGYAEPYLSKLMRKEMPTSYKKRILAAITEVKTEQLKGGKQDAN